MNLCKKSGTHSFLIEYANKIQSGEIPACWWIKLQYKLLLEDIEKPDEIFDVEEAHKRIRFIEAKCKHTKSPFAGKPVYLELWEKAIIEAAYGFYVTDENGEHIRKYTYVLLFIPRKNGKSTLAAALGNAEFFCGNWGTVIFCASNDYEQADIVFTEIDSMRDLSASLERVTRRNNTGIYFGNRKQRRKTGKFSKQNKAEIKKISARKKGKEGRNIDLAIVDESHEMEDETLIEPLVQSMSTKDECLMIEITTEGTVDDGHLDKKIQEAKAVLQGERERGQSLYFLYTMDNEEEVWTDPESWIKANPNLGVSKKMRYLTREVEEARGSSTKRSWTLCKDFNIKQSNANAWLDPEVIRNEKTFDMEDVRGRMYLGGVDLAVTTDLMCLTMLFQPELEFLAHQHFWMPKSKLEYRNDEKAGANYEQWARDGWITIVDDVDIDTAIVADYEYQMYKEFGVLPFKGGYDNRFAKSYIKRHKELFGDGILENVPQDAKGLSNPMNNTEENLRQKKINYQNNPVTYWCFKNCSYKQDNIGRIMPKRIKREMKIDGAASYLDAVFVYQSYRNEYSMI